MWRPLKGLQTKWIVCKGANGSDSLKRYVNDLVGEPPLASLWSNWGSIRANQFFKRSKLKSHKSLQEVNGNNLILYRKEQRISYASNDERVSPLRKE